MKPIGRRILQNASWGYLPVAVEGLIGLALVGVIARHFDPSEYGLLILLFASIDLVLLADFGLLGALAPAFVGIRRSDGTMGLGRFIGAVLGVAGSGALVLGVAAGGLIVLSASASVDPVVIVLAMAVLVPVTFACSVMTRALESFEAFRDAAMIRIATATARGLAVGIAIVLDLGAVGLIGAYTAPIVLRVLVSYALLQRRLAGSIRIGADRWHQVLGLWSLGRWIALESLGWQAAFGAGVLILGFAGSLSAVALLEVGRKFGYLIWGLIDRVSAATLVPIVEAIASGDVRRAREAYLWSCRFLVRLVIPALGLLASCGEYLLVLWAGNEYRHAFSVMGWYLVFALAQSLVVPSVTALYAGRDNRRVGVIALVAGAVILVASLMAVPVYGAAGAAAVLGLGLAAACVAGFVPVACARLEIPVASFWRSVLGDLVVPVAVALLVAIGIRLTLEGGTTRAVLESISGLLAYSWVWFLTRARTTQPIVPLCRIEGRS